MSNALIDEAQRQAQARNEFEARQDAAAALGGVFKWAASAAREFPGTLAVQLRKAGATLVLRYEEHDGILILGDRHGRREARNDARRVGGPEETRDVRQTA